MNGGGNRIRTCEGIRQQIYSLPPLANLGIPPYRVVIKRKGSCLLPYPQLCILAEFINVVKRVQKMFCKKASSSYTLGLPGFLLFFDLLFPLVFVQQFFSHS